MEPNSITSYDPMIEVTKRLDTLIALLSVSKPTQVNYVGGNQRYNNYNSHINAYNNHGNYGWRKRAQYPYGNDQYMLKPPPEFFHDFKEQGMGNSAFYQDQPLQKPPIQDDPVLSLLKNISTRLANNEAYCRDLGNQIAQLNQERMEHPQSSLPNPTDENQYRETTQVITLRSDKEMEPFYTIENPNHLQRKLSLEKPEVAMEKSIQLEPSEENPTIEEFVLVPDYEVFVIFKIPKESKREQTKLFHTSFYLYFSFLLIKYHGTKKSFCKNGLFIQEFEWLTQKVAYS